MGVYLNPGNDNFRMACRSEIYVDKTNMTIRDVENMSGHVELIAGRVRD